MTTLLALAVLWVVARFGRAGAAGRGRSPARKLYERRLRDAGER